jgi:DNA-binding transcriptional LysR family regulator
MIDPRLFDWNLLHALLAVLESGSLTRAAEELGLSQPTLSRRIAQLEADVGLALFERTARGLAPTATGLALAEPARQMRAAVRALSDATEQSQTLAGTVRITASEIVSAFVLPEILTRLAQVHPEIQIELVASNRIDNLLEREADLAIRMVRPTQGTLITRHLGDWTLGFFAHRRLLERCGGLTGPLAPADLSRFRWIGFDTQPDLVEGFRRYQTPGDTAIDRHFFAARSDNHIVNWMQVQAGLGIGIGLHRLGWRNPDLIEVQLALPGPVRPVNPLPMLPVWLTAHRELRTSPRLRCVWEFLADALSALR